MADPLKGIEDRKAQHDLGVFGARVFEGALTETCSIPNAYIVTVAFFRGMFAGGNDNLKEEEGGE